MTELVDIQVFVEVAKRLSFTAAANALGGNKSTVSKSVSRLEERLGLKLMNRTTRKLNLTEEGRQLFEKAQAGLQQIEDAQQELSANRQQIKGKLRIAAPMSFGLTTLVKLLPGFMGRYPRLTVELHLEDKLSEIVGEGFDVAIRIAELQDSGLVAKKLGEIRHVTVASRGYLDMHGVPQHPQDLIHHNCLIYTLRNPARDWNFTDKAGRIHNVKVEGGFESNNSLAIRECLINGVGIALVPEFVVQNDLATGRLETVMNDYAGFTRNLYAVIPDRKYINSRTRALIDYLRLETGN